MLHTISATRRNFWGWIDRHSLSLLRLGIVVALLLVSAIAGRRPSILFILPPFLLGGAWILVKWPGLGLPLTIFAAILVPFSIGTGTGSSINIAMIMVLGLVFLWILDMVKTREIDHFNQRPLMPLLMLVIVTLLSFAAGQLPWFAAAEEKASFAAQFGGVLLVVLSALAFLWVAYRINDMKWIRWGTWLFLGLSAIYVFGRLTPATANFVRQTFDAGVYNGSLFWTWMVALTLGQVLFNNRLRNWQRAGLALFIPFVFYVAYGLNSDWKSGWIPPLIALGVILFLRWPRLGVAGLLLGTIPAATILQDVLSTDLYSYSTRVDAWIIMAEIIKVSPILGLGPSNYYFYTSLFPIRGYYVQFNSHNQYVDMIAQTGLLGFVSFVWFIAEVAFLGWRLRHRVPQGFAKGYLYGTLGGLVATTAAGMLGDWIIPFVYNVGFQGFRSSVLGWMFLGGLLMMDRIYRQVGEA